ncbi:hypothetical protein Tco_0129225 [Tanacetum coccineum]
MSDSYESGVTYTEVSSPFEAVLGCQRTHTWRPLFRPHPLQITCLGPEEQSRATPSLISSKPKITDDEIVAEDQPDAEDASPTAQSPDYVPESDPEADPEEDDDEDLEEDLVDYSADGGYDGDDEHEP